MEFVLLCLTGALFILYIVSKIRSSSGAKSQVAPGGCCTFDFECNGWTLFGDVACCDNVCITKDFTLQTCPMACSLDPGGTCNWENKC